jgi:hypothetical protein
LQYEDGGQHSIETGAEWDLTVKLPPPGAITVQGDAGAVIVRVPAGAERPSLRVNGDVGLVKVEINRE